MFDKENERELELAADLAAVERHLRGLNPTAPRIDRDRLMFAAGQASGTKCDIGPGRDGRAKYIAGPSWAGRRFWPAATATMTAATILLGTMLVWRTQSPSVVQQEAKPQAVEVVRHTNDIDDDQADQFPTRQIWSTQPPATSGYLGVRHVALTRGIGALPLNVQHASDDRDLPSDDRRTTPATARGLLDQLLPASTPSTQSRS